jgi:hypothetical protein
VEQTDIAPAACSYIILRVRRPLLYLTDFRIIFGLIMPPLKDHFLRIFSERYAAFFAVL